MSHAQAQVFAIVSIVGWLFQAHHEARLVRLFKHPTLSCLARVARLHSHDAIWLLVSQVLVVVVVGSHLADLQATMSSHIGDRPLVFVILECLPANA